MNATTLGATVSLFFLVHEHEVSSSGMILQKTGWSINVICDAKSSGANIVASKDPPGEAGWSRDVVSRCGGCAGGGARGILKAFTGNVEDLMDPWYVLFLLDRDDGFRETVPADVGLEDAAEEAIARDFDLRVNSWRSWLVSHFKL